MRTEADVLLVERDEEFFTLNFILPLSLDHKRKIKAPNQDEFQEHRSLKKFKKYIATVAPLEIEEL